MTFHKLPSLRARQVVRALERMGFVKDRQKGSHLVMIHPERKLRTVVPIHSRETLSKGLVMDILKEAEISLDLFLSAL